MGLKEHVDINKLFEDLVIIFIEHDFDLSILEESFKNFDEFCIKRSLLPEFSNLLIKNFN